MRDVDDWGPFPFDECRGTALLDENHRGSKITITPHDWTTDLVFALASDPEGVRIAEQLGCEFADRYKP